MGRSAPQGGAADVRTLLPASLSSRYGVHRWDGVAGTLPLARGMTKRIGSDPHCLVGRILRCHRPLQNARDHLRRSRSKQSDRHCASPARNAATKETCNFNSHLHCHTACCPPSPRRQNHPRSNPPGGLGTLAGCCLNQAHPHPGSRSDNRSPLYTIDMEPKRVSVLRGTEARRVARGSTHHCCLGLHCPLLRTSPRRLSGSPGAELHRPSLRRGRLCQRTRRSSA